MSVNRKLQDVIDQMLVAIPEDQTQMVFELKDVQSSVIVASPEMQQHWWREVSQVLQDYILDQNVDWQAKVVRI